MNILFSSVENTEAAVQRYSVRKVFLEISQNSHLCQSLFFNKVVGLRPTAPLVAASENSHDDIIADKCFISVSVDIFTKLNKLQTLPPH